MVNDDGLIDYLVSSGYDYDTDSDSWIHKTEGTSFQYIKSPRLAYSKSAKAS